MWSVHGIHFFLVVCFNIFLFLFELDIIFLTLGHAADTGAGQTHTSGSENTEILMCRQWPCGAFADLEKRAKAAAGSSEVLLEEEAAVSEHV